jgi:cytochrome oxidase Cu insertion factor (SCO1/SenC/PrrC family)
MTRKAFVAGVVAAALLAGGGIGVAAALLSGKNHSSAHAFGYHENRPVPPVRLTDQDGRSVSLASFRGKVVVLSPFLSLCSEVCPLTTGVFERLQRQVAAHGLGKRVVFTEITVDPWRDSPARLRAFARMTHVRFPLLTGSKNEIARVWRFFGVGYRRVPQGKPPAIDWWTHKPLTFDVEHTDGVFFIDTRGTERLFMIGMPAAGKLPTDLKSLLSETGLQNLRHPMGPWTPAQARADLEFLLGRKL